MRIKGFTQYNTLGFDMHTYDAAKTNCTSDNARSFGSSVCDDVIQIPVNSGTDVQVVQISVFNDYLTLCEVQVFAGNLIENKSNTLNTIIMVNLGLTPLQT